MVLGALSTSGNAVTTSPKRSGRLVALGALVLLALIVAGIPLGLVQLGKAMPIDFSSLTIGSLRSADEGQSLLILLLAIAWGAWSVLFLSIGVEAFAISRRVATPRLPGLGGPQKLAASLVGAIAFGVVSPVGVWASPSHEPSDLSGVVSRVVDAASTQMGAVSAEAVTTEANAMRKKEPELPVIVTERHDTLWLLAEQYLGKGERFREILALNQGDQQQDGRSLGDGLRVYPGWSLKLPADAILDGVRVPRHRVSRGDTLWEIAEEELGAARRYKEIVELNKGETQVGGESLRVAETILPGWILELPSTSAQEPRVVGQANDAISRAGLEATRDIPDLGATGSMPSMSTTDENPLPPDGSNLGAEPETDSALTGSASGKPAEELPSIDRLGVAAPPLIERSDDPFGEKFGVVGSGILLPSGGIAGALLLAGLGAELVRRRRRFQRHRLAGERMQPISAGAAELADTLVSAAAEVPKVPWRPAIDALVASMRDSGRGRPPIRTLTVGRDVRIQLSEKCDPVAPFLRLDDQNWILDSRWRPTGGSEADWDPEVVDRSWDESLALLVIGMSGDDLLLVNLEMIGTLEIVGDSQRKADVLRALMADLSLGNGLPGVEGSVLVESDQIAPAADAGAVLTLREAAEADSRLHRYLGQTSDQQGSRIDPFEVLMTDQELSVAVEANSGVALVTTAGAPNAGGTLVLEDDGTAILLPDGIPMVPQGISIKSAGEIVELLDSAAIPDTSAAVTPEGSQRVAVPRLLMLGEVRVADATGKAEPTRISRLSETAIFVALNPDSRPSALQSALWPGRRSNPATCRQMVSRARTWLGRTEEGHTFLMPFSDTIGRLRLRPEITSDWDDFQQLAHAGLSDPGDVVQLTEALALVRGRPFGPVAGRELAWADLHLNEMISLITDVAAALAERQAARGNWRAARDAALRGLSTESESEVLKGIVAALPVVA